MTDIEKVERAIFAILSPMGVWGSDHPAVVLESVLAKRAAKAAIAACNEWQPIEDAPRDKTVLFSKYVKGRLFWMTTGYLDPDDGLYYCDVTDRPLKFDTSASFQEPTHFRLIEGPDDGNT